MNKKKKFTQKEYEDKFIERTVEIYFNEKSISAKEAIEKAAEELEPYKRKNILEKLLSIFI